MLKMFMFVMNDNEIHYENYQTFIYAFAAYFHGQLWLCCKQKLKRNK